MILNNSKSGLKSDSIIYHRRKVLIAVQIDYFISDALAACSVYAHSLRLQELMISKKYILFEVKLEYHTFTILPLFYFSIDILLIKRWICMCMSLKYTEKIQMFFLDFIKEAVYSNKIVRFENTMTFNISIDNTVCQ